MPPRAAPRSECALGPTRLESDVWVGLSRAGPHVLGPPVQAVLRPSAPHDYAPPTILIRMAANKSKPADGAPTVLSRSPHRPWPTIAQLEDEAWPPSRTRGDGSRAGLLSPECWAAADGPSVSSPSVAAISSWRGGGWRVIGPTYGIAVCRRPVEPRMPQHLAEDSGTTIARPTRGLEATRWPQRRHLLIPPWQHPRHFAGSRSDLNPPHFAASVSGKSASSRVERGSVGSTWSFRRLMARS